MMHFSYLTIRELVSCSSVVIVIYYVYLKEPFLITQCSPFRDVRCDKN